jgi:ubiquinone/menaquinone biosynthesis C-methylase UbiE
MTNTPNVQYLLNEQYKDGSNLSARANIHTRFSINKYGWFNWLFDQYSIPANAKILEVGAGTGWQWAANAKRISPGWDITLSDFSSGMLDEARKTVAHIDYTFKFEQIDVQAIPYEDERFDAVFAHYMLYHVPDRAGAIAELRRVLKPGGTLYTATTGRAHLREIYQLVSAFDPTIPYKEGFAATFSYVLENAALLLAEQFDSVEVRRYADGLLVTEVDPLVDYVLSLPAKAYLMGEKLDEFREFVAAELAKTGSISITKDTGVLIAS